MGRPARHRTKTINIAAQDFRKQWGFQPRGTALWTFYFSDLPNTPWRCAQTPVTYTEAKRLAVAEARKRNVSAIRLDPNPEGFKLYRQDSND